MISILNIIIHDCKTCSEATIDQRVTRHPYCIIWYNIYLLDRFLMEIYNFPPNIFSVPLWCYPEYYILCDAFFMHPSGKWKLLLTTSSICYTNCKQSTTVINYTCVCVCALLSSSKRPWASETAHFLYIRRRWSLSFIYISSRAQNVFFIFILLFFLLYII